MNRRDFFSVCTNVGSTILSAEGLRQICHNYTEGMEKRVHESEAILNDKLQKLNAVIEDRLTTVHNRLNRQAFDITATKAHLAFLTTWVFIVCITYGLDLAIRLSALLISVI